MILESFQWKDNNWTKPLPTNLDSDSTLIVVFGNASEEVSKLKQSFPLSQMMGCSVAGEIYGEELFHNTLSVVVMKLEKTRLKVVCQPISVYEDSFEAGKKMHDALQDKDLCAILTLNECFNTNTEKYVHGLAGENKAGEGKIDIFGGVSGDYEIKNTWIFHEGKAVERAAVAAGFYGKDFKVVQHSLSGAVPLGAEKKVTMAEKNVLVEIDNRPALVEYKKYLGPRGEKLHESAIEFPIGLSNNFDMKKGEEVIRTAQGIDPEKQTVVFTGEIEIGSSIRLMMSSQEGFLDSVKQIVDYCRETLGDNFDKNCLILPISCLGRKLLFGSNCAEELNPIHEAFNKENQHIAGFYSFGEIATNKNKRTLLQNQTMTLVIMYED